MVLANPEYISSFNQLSPNALEYNIVGFDTEDNSDGTPVSFAFWDGGKNTKDGYYYTTCVKDAENFILNYPETTIFIAHNLEYDINNLCMHNNFKYIDEEIKTPTLVKATLIGSKNYFMNSHSFFFGPLSKMGDVVGEPKLSGDEQNVFNPKYVITDAKIVYLYMTELQRQLNKDYGIRIRTTIGSTAMAIYRTCFMENKKQVTYNNPELLRAYYGGRTEIFYKGIIKGPIKVVDINSSYPNVMQKYEFPDTSTLNKSSIKTHKFGVGKFTVRVDPSIHIPVLPYKSPEGKLFFPVGEFTGYWTYQEIRYAEKFGTEIIIEHDGVGTNKGCRPFKSYMDYHYNMREKDKVKIKEITNIQNKTPIDLINLNVAQMGSTKNKYFQNTLYGKFCQHKANGLLCRRPQTSKQLEFKMNGMEFNHTRIGPFHEYKQTEDTPAKTANYLWGIYTTSYARIELHKHIANVHDNGGIVLYCDTDSVMYSGDLPEGTLDLGPKLGQLEYETTNDGREFFDMALFRQAKGYLICNYTGKTKKGLKELEIVKSACKGVPTEFAYDFILRNMASFDKPMKQREYFISAYAKNSTIKRKVGLNVWDTVEKKMNLEYIKRIGQGITRPVNSNEIEALEINVRGATVETFEENLKDFGFSINRKEPKKIFTKCTIPKGWKRSYKWEMDVEKKLKSRKIIYLKTIHFDNLEDDTTWFSGYIKGIRNDKFSEYLEIELTQFEGDILPFNGLKAWINVKTFNKLFLLKKYSKDLVNTLVTVTKIDDEEIKIEAIQNNTPVDFKELSKEKEKQQKQKLIDYLNKKGKI
jgi:hypothetical protein